MQLPVSDLTATGSISVAFRKLNITDFHAACDFVHQLPYGRNTSRSDFTLVLSEKQGTCSSKHALLALLAEENALQNVELIVGIYLLSEETNPQAATVLAKYKLTNLPECHVYLRYKGKRYDFTFPSQSIAAIENKIVREQRIEPQQVIDWKIVIHKDYLTRWLARNPSIAYDLNQIWAIREEIIAQLV